MYLGSYGIDEYVPIPVTTHRFSTGAAYACTSLTYSIYEEGNTTGLDEDVDMTPASPFDSITGFFYARRQLTAAAGFENNKTYVVLVKATVDSVAAIESHVFQVRPQQTGDSYAVVAHADYGNAKLVRSTTPANTLTVDASHLVGVPATQKVDLETIKTQAITCAAGVTVLASVGTAATSTAQTGDGYAIVNNGTYGNSALKTLIDAVDDYVDAEVGALTTELAKVPKSDSNVSWNATALAAIQAEATASIVAHNLDHLMKTAVADGDDLTTEVADGTVLSNILTKTGDTSDYARATDAVEALQIDLAAVLADTGTDGVAIAAGAIDTTQFAAGGIDAAAIAADAIDADALAQDAAQEIADEVLNRNLAGGGSGNTRNVRNALRVLRNQVSIAAGTMTVTTEDDATEAWTAEVETAAGNPISAIKPAGP